MEEFNIYDLYLNQVKQDDIYNSKEYKFLKDNNIDTAEIEGIDPEPEAGEIKFDKNQKISEAEDKVFLKDVTDFVLDIPRDTFISALRGGSNGLQFINNFAGAIGLTEESTVDEFNEKINKIKTDLDNAQEDSSLVTKMIGMAGQDAMYVYPIYKKLEKAGIPKMWRMPISFALGGALAFDKSESFFVDSNSMRNLKEYIGIAPDTPIEEMYDKTVQAIEFGAFGKIFDDILGLAKNYKKMNKDRVKQADIAVGGAAGSAAVVEQFTEDPNQATNEMMPNLNPSEEKKNPNFNDDQSSIPGTVNEYGFEKTAGLGPVFRSVLKETAKNIPNKGSGRQILGQIINTPGVKQQELKWTGLDDFLKSKKTVTKEEVKQYLENNTLDVTEINLPRKTNLDPKLEELYKNVNEDYGKLYDDLKTLPQNQGRMVDPFRYTLKNIDDYGIEALETVDMDTLDNVFIGQRLNSYIPPSAMMSKMSKGNYFDKSKLIDDFGKEGDPNTLEFFMFEDNVSGRLTAHSKKNFDKVNGQEDLMSGGKYEFAYKTEMNIKEAEMFMFMKLRDRLDRVVTKERNAGKTKFGGVGYVEPGGEDYKEIIFKLKGDRGYPVEVKGTLQGKVYKTESPYRSPEVHFGTTNEFAHVRFKTREIPGPRAGVKEGSLKVLSVEEMQSDIVQDMKKGTITNNVQDFPFKNNWYELVTKRLIRYAADNNFDAIAIPKGKTIADRYRQTLFDAKAVDIQITAGKIKGTFNFDLEFFNKGQKASKEIMSFDETDYSKIKDVIGIKEYQKLEQKFDDIVNGKILQTDDSKIINERITFDKPKQLGTGIGKAQLYDQAIPSFLRKYGKKWNAKVYDDEFEIKPKLYQHGQIYPKIPVTIIKLTDEMKQSVQQDSQALFNIFGIGSAAAIGSDAVLQNDRNNTISNLTEN